MKRPLLAWILAALPFLNAWGATNALNLVPPPDAFRLRRMNLLPPPLPVRVIPVSFPVNWPVVRVMNLGTIGDRLWINARGVRQTNGLGGKVWVFSPRNNRIDPLLGRIAQHQVADMDVRRDGVWMALDGGVAAVDPNTLVVDSFAAPQGLTSGDLLGFADAAQKLFVFSRAGVLFDLNPNGKGWMRAGDTSSQTVRRIPSWRMIAGSGDWLLVVGDEQLLGRHQAGSQFEELQSTHWEGLPSVNPPKWTALAGDGDGGFWLGSDLGLHFVLPETGSMEHRIAPQAVTIPGGLQGSVPPGYQYGPAFYDAARTRVATGIRERMRVRARLTRMGLELKRNLDPVTPTTRLPGGIRALKADGPFLWVAAQEGTNTVQTDILLFHPGSRKWVARAVVPGVVSALAVDEDHLWIGCDLTRSPRSPALLMLDRHAMTKIPAVRWISDEIPAAELAARLSSLPVREQAVLAFFAGDAARVSALLEGQAEDAEGLFMEAFAKDTTGQGANPVRDEKLARLREKFPNSPFTEATKTLGVAKASVPPPARPGTEAAADQSVPSLATLFRRRDLDGDGRIDLKEYQDWRGPDADLKPYDANGDGVLNVDEFDMALRGGK